MSASSDSQVFVGLFLTTAFNLFFFLKTFVKKLNDGSFLKLRKRVAGPFTLALKNAQVFRFENHRKNMSKRKRMTGTVGQSAVVTRRGREV